NSMTIFTAPRKSSGCCACRRFWLARIPRQMPGTSWNTARARWELLFKKLTSCVISPMTHSFWAGHRSEERRVGKECRSEWGQERYKKTVESGVGVHCTEESRCELRP